MTDTILVVDDEQRIIELAQMYLEQEGYLVNSANDGGVALRKILNEKPSLVVLDLMLPGMDGLEVCRRVRAESELSCLPHEMMTLTRSWGWNLARTIT
jgi:two-component system, OmpR family, alkaline phosphatase synthesis response regulator PhoP